MSQAAAQKAEKSAEKPQQGPENASKEAEGPQNQPETDNTQPETQKVKFLRSHPGYGYWPGNTADLTAEHVTLLVEGKFAELVVEAETEPED